MIRIAVCDDFSDDRLEIIKYVSEYLEEYNTAYKIAQFESCEEIVSEYRELNGSFDFLFLDVYTGKMNGFEAAHFVRQFDKNVPIVFATSSIEDAVNGYEVNAAGYLIKPVDRNKLRDILCRVNTTGTADHEGILLKVKTGYRNFKLDEIYYLESNRNTVNIYTIDNQCFTMYAKLNDLEEQFDDPRFLRCHQSYLVNMNYILEADNSFKMKNGERVPIRVKGHKEIVEKYCFYCFEK